MDGGILLLPLSLPGYPARLAQPSSAQPCPVEILLDSVDSGAILVVSGQCRAVQYIYGF